MSDHERIRVLERRLNDIEHRKAHPWELPALEAARLALCSEITELGRRLVRRESSRLRAAS